MKDYEEPEAFSIFDMRCKVTASQQREIVLRYRKSEQYLRWHALDSMIRCHHICGDDLEVMTHSRNLAFETARELAQAECELTIEVNRIIADVTKGCE